MDSFPFTNPRPKSVKNLEHIYYDGDLIFSKKTRMNVLTLLWSPFFLTDLPTELPNKQINEQKKKQQKQQQQVNEKK